MINNKIKNTLLLVLIIFLTSACTGTAVDLGGTLFGGSMMDEVVDGTGDAIPGGSADIADIDDAIPTADSTDPAATGSDPSGASIICIGANCANNDSEDDIDPTSGEYIDGNTEVVSIPAPPPMEEDNEPVEQDGSCENEDETDSVVERCAEDAERPEAMQSRGRDFVTGDDDDLDIERPDGSAYTDDDGNPLSGEDLLDNMGGRDFRGHDSDDDDGFGQRLDTNKRPKSDDDDGGFGQRLDTNKRPKSDDDSSPLLSRGETESDDVQGETPGKRCQPTITTFRCTRGDDGELTWQETNPLRGTGNIGDTGKAGGTGNVLVLEYFTEEGDLEEEVIDFSGSRRVDTNVFTRQDILKGEPKVFIRNTDTGEEEETTVRVRNPQVQKTPSLPALQLNVAKQQDDDAEEDAAEEAAEEEDNSARPSRSFTPSVNFSAPFTVRQNSK
jgi:hypothetical protein